VINEALDRKLHFESMVHPKAILGRNIKISDGTIICAGNILTTDIQIGKYVLLNLACTVGHDCVIEDDVVISPGCNISGGVRIGQGAYIGTGAKILEGLKIGQHAIVGAGAVVTKDIPDGVVAVGVPAKVVKTREPTEYISGSQGEMKNGPHA
jgi:sugar O-acyltransferase (sialic acid O-acetyltransferase NeuD family)